MTSSRFARIAHDLRERIALGELGEDGSVDSEAELCRRYEVSRPTVRRALELLRDQGLVESRHGAGWFATGSAFHQRLALGTFRHAASAVAEAGKSVRAAGGRVRLPGGAVRAGRQPAGRRRATTCCTPGRCARSTARRSTSSASGCPPTSPARSAGPTPPRPGIWETLVRQGHRIATVRQTITAGAATDDDADAARRRAGHAAAPGAPAGDRRRRPAARAVRPPLPRAPLRARGRVQQRAGVRGRPSRPACARCRTTTTTSRRCRGAHRMKVLVTGGAGFIGANFVHRAVATRPDWEITVVDALTYAGNRDNLAPVADKIAFVEGNIADAELVDRLVARHRPGDPLRRRVAQRQLAERPVAVHRVQHHRDLPAARGGAQARQAAAPRVDRRGVRRPRARRPEPLHRVAPRSTRRARTRRRRRRPTCSFGRGSGRSRSPRRCRTARTTTGRTSTSRSSSRGRSRTSCPGSSPSCTARARTSATGSTSTTTTTR